VTFWNDLLADRLNCLKLLYGAFLPCFLAALFLGDPFLSWAFSNRSSFADKPLKRHMTIDQKSVALRT
jgi:hypothetical protein